MRHRLFSLFCLIILIGSFVGTVWPTSSAAAATAQGYAYTSAAGTTILSAAGDVSYKASSADCQSYATSNSSDGIINVPGNSNGNCNSTAATLNGPISCVGKAGCKPGTATQIVITPASSLATGGGTLTGTWVDHSEINVDDIPNSDGTVTFNDGKIDGNLEYTATTTIDGCQADYINEFTGSPTAAAAANETVILHTFSVPGGGLENCTEVDYKINFLSPGNFTDNFTWQDAGTISTTDVGHVFIQSSTGQPYLDTGSNCESQIIPDNGVGSENGALIIRWSGTEPFTDGWPTAITNAEDAAANSNIDGCHVSAVIQVALADPLDANGNPVSTDPAGSSTAAQNDGDTGGGGDDTTPSLSCSAGYNPLNWLLCAAVKGMVNIVGDVDNLINSLLSIGTTGNSGSDPSLIFGDIGSSDAGATASYHTAWSSFRDISLGLLAIVGLVIIVSQAMGLEILDAYSIRKAMPRLVIAAVAITLSWQLLGFFVQFTNELGYGIRFLILNPFNSLGDHANLGGGGNVATGLLALGALGALGIFGLLSFAVTAALSVFVAYLTLVIRQILIILLIIVSPIAIVAYILPNTNRVYKIWWDSFSKGLLMFPLIAAFIAAGRAFSAIALEGNPGPVSQLIGIAAYFAPYFLLPVTFRFAGGALANIGGFVNDRHKGAFDRLKRFRSQQPTRRYHKAKEGELYKGTNPISKRMSTIAQGVALSPKAGLNPVTMRAKMSSAVGAQNFAKASKIMQEGEAMAVIKSNDGQLDAFINGNNAGQVRQILINRDQAAVASGKKASLMDPAQLDRATQEVMNAKRESGDQAGLIAAGRLQATTGTGFADSADMYETINKIAGSDRTLATRMLGEMKGATNQSGRTDLGGASFGIGAGAMEDLNNGAITAAQATDRTIDSVIQGNGGAGAIYGKKTSAEQVGRGWARRIDTINASLSAGDNKYTTRDLSQAMASIGALQTAIGSVSPENGASFANEVMGRGIVLSSLAPQARARLATSTNGAGVTTSTTAPGITVREAIENLRSADPEFAEMERSYGNSISAAARSGAITPSSPGTPSVPGAIPGPGGGH